MCRPSTRMWPSCTSSGADADGNAHIWGIIGEQKEAAFAAKQVILTAEEIVDEEVIRSDPNRTLIPGFIVDAVCQVPYCAHPSYTQGYYDRDNSFYLQWDKISAIQTEPMQHTWMNGCIGVERPGGILGKAGRTKCTSAESRQPAQLPWWIMGNIRHELS